MRNLVRIGSGSGMPVDSVLGMQAMLTGDSPEYLIFDHLAEATMSPFLQMQRQSPDMGYSPGVADLHIGPHIAELMSAGIKVVTNGGGLNPHGAARAIRRYAEAAGVSPRIAVIEGDNVTGRITELAEDGFRDMFSGESWPETLLLANAYLGAFPIARALAMGADIVLTGRVADSALTLGILVHEFGWGVDDYDVLAAGTAAGHLLECGAQATGGTFTDWADLPDNDNIGFPIAECRPDGTFVITKPADTGGLVTVGTVSEQLLYEVSDPAAYYVADVACDFTTARIRQIADNRVEVSGVRGNAPNGCYKVTSILEDGWRAIGLIPVLSGNATELARRVAQGLLSRTQRLLDRAGLAPPRVTHFELIGAGETFVSTMPRNARQTEVVLRIVYVHDDEKAVNIFRNELMANPTNAAPGMVAMFALPQVSQIHRLYSFLLPRDRISATITLDDVTETLPPETAQPRHSGVRDPLAPDMRPGGGSGVVPLEALAWVRSGDKGNIYNLGVIAREPDYLPHIRAALTEASVGAFMRHTFDDPQNPDVTRHDLPAMHAMNFVMRNALGGGGSVQLRLDGFAKTMGQQLLQMPVPVPQELAARWHGHRLTG